MFDNKSFPSLLLKSYFLPKLFLILFQKEDNLKWKRCSIYPFDLGHLLSSMIKPRSISETDCICSRKYSKNHVVLRLYFYLIMPSFSKTLWITNNILPPVSYSSKTNATGFCITMEVCLLNSVTCLPSFNIIASFPIKSILLMWLSRFTLMQGQFNLAATCSICVDLPVPWYPYQNSPY